MLRCKKDFEIINGSKTTLLFQKGCMYEIFIEFDDCYWIFCDDVDCHKFLKEKDHRGDRYFKDFFCDIQEVRKQKLDKLTEVVYNNESIV